MHRDIEAEVKKIEEGKNGRKCYEISKILLLIENCLF